MITSIAIYVFAQQDSKYSVSINMKMDYIREVPADQPLYLKAIVNRYTDYLIFTQFIIMNEKWEKLSIGEHKKAFVF